jgi:hypothetical protein
MMRTVICRPATISILCLFAAGMSGCVWKSTYDNAVADMAGAKAELESAKNEQQRLAQQVRTLEPITQDSTREAETAAADLQRAKDEAEAERRAGEERLARLTRTMNQLTAQQSNLRDALQRAKGERPALQALVDKYKSKLEETEGFRTPTFPPPLSQIPEPGSAPTPPPAQIPTPTSLSPAPMAPPPPAPAATPAPSPMPQPAPKRPAEPADEGFFSALKGWLVSLWRSVFS